MCISDRGRSVPARESRFLKFLQRVTDELRELMEHRDNRFILENVSLIEAYFERRLPVICNLKISGARYGIDPPALRNKEVKAFEPSTAFVLSACSSEFNDRNNRDQQPMLIDNVEIVKSVQEIIASSVRLYLVYNKTTDPWRRL
jgi:hypothetical protein